MDVYHHRRENVRRLCRDEHSGSISEMANRLDRQQSLVSRWIGKTKNPKPIGSRTARRIEVEYRKPVGWLDIPHHAPGLREEGEVYEYAATGDRRAALSEEAVEFAEGFQLMPEHIRNYFRLLLNEALVREHGSRDLQKAFAASSLKDQLHFNRRLKIARKKYPVRSRRKKKGK